MNINECTMNSNDYCIIAGHDINIHTHSHNNVLFKEEGMSTEVQL